jgi:hypothetical protein
VPIAFVVGFARQAQAAETPADFLAAIFEHYHDPKGGIVLDTPDDIRRWFEPDIAGQMIDDAAQATEAGDVPSMDGDPFVDAQDFDIKDVKITIDNESADMAKGTVAFTNFGEAKSIHYDLVMTGSGWRIRDIEWPEGTLRGVFTH